MKNKLILIGGYGAAGKSTFARNLSQKLNIPCFIKDTIKETLGDGFGPESGEVFEKGGWATFLIMLHITESFMHAENICILESNFKMSEIEQIKILLEKYNGECLTFRFRGDLDIMFDRYSNRDKERHWVHKSAGNREGFKKVWSSRFGLDELNFGQIVDVNTTDFANVDYNELYSIAKKFIEE